MSAIEIFTLLVGLYSILSPISAQITPPTNWPPIGDNVTSSCQYVKFYNLCPEKLINPSNSPCNSDNDCKGGRLCCSSGLGAKPYCSDIAGSKEYLKCPKTSIHVGNNGSKAKCFTDRNCGGGNLKCCPDESDCNSYCEAGEANCFNLPNKPNNICPSQLPPNATKFCSSNDQCPGNQVCCDTSYGRKCADPKQLRAGTCPKACNLITAGAARCYSDGDCGLTEKCCRFDDCNYFCSEVLFNGLGRSGKLLLSPRPTI